MCSGRARNTFDKSILPNCLILSMLISQNTSRYNLLKDGMWIARKKKTHHIKWYFTIDNFTRLLKNKEWKLAKTFNFSFRYIDDVLSLNNYRFGYYLHHIYPNVLTVKDTTDTEKFASYLELHIEIDNGWRLNTKLYDKRDYFTFPYFH